MTIDMTMRTPTTDPQNCDRDRGIMLPMVLVATVVFTIIGVAIAGLVTTGLRYGNVVEERADRLAAADGGLRYGVERLRNMEDLCSTGLGGSGGYTTIFPPTINGAATSVTCRRVGKDISDVQGWGVVITGSNVPGGQDIFLLNGSATTDTKSLRGPVYIADPHRLGFNAVLVIEDGDMWYTQPSCDPPAVIPEMASSDLLFEPSFLRGPQCSTKPWNQMFTPPSAQTPTTAALQVPSAFDDTSFPGCRVFSPGRYSGAIPLTSDDYFRSGDYYFENVDFTLAHKNVVFGFPSGSGDTPRITQSGACQDAMLYDQTTSGDRGGATIWAGGNTHFEVGTQAELEIFRRQQSEAYISLWALDVNGIGSNGVSFIPSIHSYKKAPSVDWILETAGGNTNDVAFHGLLWAPHSKVRLGNVTNAAVGQLIGGVVIAQLDAQASNSASAFAIGVEGTPIETHFLLESTATKDGDSTTIRAVVQYRPDSRQLAVNSWRVAD